MFFASARMKSTVKIEIIYATPDEQALMGLEVLSGATVGEAIQLSGILELYPEIDLNKNAVGIFSRKVLLDEILQEGDRIEIYRPLKIDPKEARRLRHLRSRKSK